jgi:hypothetical protein
MNFDTFELDTTEGYIDVHGLPSDCLLAVIPDRETFPWWEGRTMRFPLLTISSTQGCLGRESGAENMYNLATQNRHGGSIVSLRCIFTATNKEEEIMALERSQFRADMTIQNISTSNINTHKNSTMYVKALQEAKHIFRWLETDPIVLGMHLSQHHAEWQRVNFIAHKKSETLRKQALDADPSFQSKRGKAIVTALWQKCKDTGMTQRAQLVVRASGQILYVAAHRKGRDKKVFLYAKAGSEITNFYRHGSVSKADLITNISNNISRANTEALWASDPNVGVVYRVR